MKPARASEEWFWDKWRLCSSSYNLLYMATYKK